MAEERRPRSVHRPVFVIAAPYSGAEQVQAVLAAAEGTGTLTGDEHPLAAAPKLAAVSRGHDTSRLGFQDAKSDAIGLLEDSWRERGATADHRVVLTWSEAALQVRFLAAAWPRASFVFVHRDPVDSLTAMLAAWESGTAVSYPELPGWNGPWSLPLTPEWRSLTGHDLSEVVIDQWRRLTDAAVGDLMTLPRRSWTAVSYHDLLAHPGRELDRIGAALQLTWTEQPALGEIPAAPATDRLTAHLATIAATAQRARDLLDLAAESTPDDAGVREATSPYASSSTPNFAELLSLIGSTLAVTTYQTGRVVLMRAQDGALNTHFRALDRPMGMAYRPGILSVGTKSAVWTFHDVPGLADRVGREHDAVLMPRSMLQTGDIRIHDLAWAGDDLWAVNTRFSCLVTFDGAHSFVPRWQPSFITDLTPEDRCHLNGLAVVDGRPKYVTALGTTDTAGGWRPGKASGGVIIDIETDEVVAGGLSMPHSPRWHADRLWVLESGEGTLAWVDASTGEVTTVASLPGFTRGLAFAGRYAFVGLSQVREATTFGGLPLTGRLEDRQCGVWIVDIETGQTMGFVRFEERVQEIFEVALLPGLRFPELLEPGAREIETAYVLPPPR